MSEESSPNAPAAPISRSNIATDNVPGITANASTADDHQDTIVPTKETDPDQNVDRHDALGAVESNEGSPDQQTPSPPQAEGRRSNYERGRSSGYRDRRHGQPSKRGQGQQAQRNQRRAGRQDTNRTNASDEGREVANNEEDEESLRAEISRLRNQLSAQKLDFKASDNQIRRLQTTINENNRLLETRGLELKAAQTFLSTGDDCSTGDLVDMTQALNNEIFQLASFMSNEVPTPNQPPIFVFNPPYPPRIERVRRTAGEVLIQCLTGSVNPTLVQFAFQAVLTRICKTLIQTWNLSRPEDDEVLSRVYRTIRERETQSIFGKWRALAHIHATFEKDSPMMGHLTCYLSDHMMDIYIALGSEENPMLSLTEDAQKAYWERVVVIVKHCIRVRDATFRQITSGDVTIGAIPPGTLFNEKEMTDMYEEESKGLPGEQKVVACTTELGLHMAKKIQGGPCGGTWERSWLLKPKVVLERLLTTL